MQLLFSIKIYFSFVNIGALDNFKGNGQLESSTLIQWQTLGEGGNGGTESSNLQTELKEITMPSL